MILDKIFLQLTNSTSTQSTELSIDTLVSIFLVAGTFLLVGITYWKTRESNKELAKSNKELEKSNEITRQQLELTKKEFEYRIRPDLELGIGETDVKDLGDGKIIIKIVCYLRNVGTIEAKNAQISFIVSSNEPTLYDLVKSERSILTEVTEIKGSIKPQQNSHSVPLEKKVGETRLYYVPIWVRFDYAGVKEDEFIQLVTVNIQHHEEKIRFSKEQIDEERKNQNS